MSEIHENVNGMACSGELQVAPEHIADTRGARFTDCKFSDCTFDLAGTDPMPGQSVVPFESVVPSSSVYDFNGCTFSNCRFLNIDTADEECGEVGCDCCECECGCGCKDPGEYDEMDEEREHSDSDILKKFANADSSIFDHTFAKNGTDEACDVAVYITRQWLNGTSEFPDRKAIIYFKNKTAIERAIARIISTDETAPYNFSTGELRDTLMYLMLSAIYTGMTPESIIGDPANNREVDQAKAACFSELTVLRNICMQMISCGNDGCASLLKRRFSSSPASVIDLCRSLCNMYRTRYTAIPEEMRAKAAIYMSMLYNVMLAALEKARENEVKQ